MRFMYVVLGLLCAGPLLASTAQKNELAEVKAQLSALTDYVKKLESRLAAQERGALETGTGDADPLATAEKELGYGAGGKPTPAPAPAAPAAPAGDVLDAAERDMAAAKATAPVLGNPRTAFNPQVSVIGDFVYRASSLDEDPTAPDANGLPTGDRNRDRFSLRELEVGFQAAIDPFSRADIFLELPGVLEEFEDDAAEAREQKIEVEEAYITYWRLPWNFQLKGGKFRLEFGKNNREHNDNQHAVERPAVVRNFLGGEGIAEQGLSLQTFIPINGPGTQLELTGQIINGEGGEETLFAGAGSDKTMGLGRVRLYHDIDSSQNIDLGVSHMSGHHDPAGQLRQRLTGLDATYRWEPVGQNLYKQLIVRGEYIDGNRRVIVDDTSRDRIAGQRAAGYYVMAQYHWDRFWNVGLRYDRTDTALRNAELSIDPDPAVRDRAIASLDRLDARTIWVTHFTSEFNRWRLQYIDQNTNFPVVGKTDEQILLAQWIFAMGPHGAHKY